MTSIERLLRPRSVAVVGASATPGALGASVIANLDRLGFAGQLYLINPNRERIGARVCLKSVADLPEQVDAAVLAIPRVAVLDCVRTLAERGTGAAIIFSAGFAEGGDAGRAEQMELARIARDAGMIIEGPNCLGLVNYVDGIALTFVETPALALDAPGGVGLLSQSGALAAVVGVTLASRRVGMSYSVSTGNEAVSGVEDFLEFLLEDARTTVIGLVVEQFRQPRRFLELARQARSRNKTVVLLHPGRSNAARESAATHTGAMAGDYAVMRASVARAGVVIAESLEEFADLLEVSWRCGAVAAGGTAVITESGAFKAVALDLCEQLGLSLPAMHDADSPALRAALPEFVPVSNPVDLTAQALADADLYRRSLAALIDDPRCAHIMLGIIQTDARTSDLKFPSVLSAIRKLRPGKPLLFAGLDEGAAVPAHYIEDLRALGVPYFPSPERAFRALRRLTLAAEIEPPAASVETLTVSPLAAGVVPEYRAKQWLGPLGIPFPHGEMATDLEAAYRAARALGFPVALKAQAPALSHKSDAGGVVLNLADEAALAAGWRRMHEDLARHCPGLTLDGVLVERMGRRGTEMIIGARNDPHWGPIVLVGFGGIQAEVLQDVRLLTAGLSRSQIEAEILQLRSAAILRGFRGAPPLDVAALASIAARIGAIMAARTSIAEIDLNPVMVYPVGEGAVALDALMLVRS